MTTNRTFGVQAWVQMFHAAGLDQAMMNRWHHEFETEWPQDHERFLSWLGVPADEIVRVRSTARTERHP